MAGFNYRNLIVSYECACPDVTKSKWDRLMKGAVKANKREVERIIRQQLPWLYEQLALQFHNPYGAYRTETHLIYVHSSIEYFLKIERR